jgi:hypothetical protein
VSDARRAGDIDKAYDLIAETMKHFGNSTYGKTVTNKRKKLFQLLTVTKIIFLKRLIAHISKI